MKVKIVAVLAAAAALSFAAVGSAAAQSLRPANQDEAAAPPQVNGARLQTAMLSPSAFQRDVVFAQALNSGTKLQTTQIRDHVPSMSCASFEGTVKISVFGDTAGAYEEYTDENAVTDYPDVIFQGDEEVLQFATVAAATTFYGQVRTKYTSCTSFSESWVRFFTPTEQRTFTATVASSTVTKTTVSGDTAFTVTQGVQLADFLQQPLYFNVLYVVAGTDVYSFHDTGGTNDEPSLKLMTSFIHRVQALYPHT
jgi:hypothetical protein